MKTSICHYSFHRTWKENNWSCDDLVSAVKALGVDGVDFHVGYLDSPKEAPALITRALQKSGLELSGLSLSNNFNQTDPQELKKQVQTVIEWLQVAAEIQAPASRIFGGTSDRSDKTALAQSLTRIVDGIGQVVREAEKLGIMLAIENHGGLPGTAEEQVEVIKKINSKNLRATVDVGNYMVCGQEADVGVGIAASYAEYIHFKDFKKKSDAKTPWGWSIEACTLGQGDVDHKACLQHLKKAGYDSFITLEYEGPIDETVAVPQSVEYMKQVIQKIQP